MTGDILIEAHKLINGERAAQYGPADTGFTSIAAMWSAYLGKQVSAQDVCCLMCLLKLARQAHCPSLTICWTLAAISDLQRIWRGETVKIVVDSRERNPFAFRGHDIYLIRLSEPLVKSLMKSNKIKGTSRRLNDGQNLICNTES